MIIGSRQRLKQVNINSINVAGSDMALAKTACNIGLHLDSCMTMEAQVNSIVSSSWYHLHNLSKIRKHLDQNSTEKLVHAFITSKLDLNNALLYGLPDTLIKKLERVHNASAKLVVGAGRFENSQLILKKLHWLPVKQRIVYKILLLCFNAIRGLTAGYLSDLIGVKCPTRPLRFNESLTLESANIQYTNNFGDRAFSAAAPKLWNNLPSALRDEQSLDNFKLGLKTYLFNIAFY